MAINEQPAVKQPVAYWSGYEAPDADPAAYKRSGTTKPELLKRFSQRVKMSAKWRKDEGYDATWRRLIDLYAGKQFESVSPEDRVAVNIAFSTVNTIAPSVSVNNPHVTVNARQEAELPQAEACEAAVNYWWEHYKFQREARRAVKDSLVTGQGWLKIGWKYETKQVAQTQADIEAAQNEASDAAETNPAEAAEQPTDAEIAAQTKTVVTKDCPFVDRVSPFDIFVDPEATCDEDLKWIAQKLVVPLADVRKDDRYKKAARSRLEPDASTNARWRDGEGTEGEAGQKYSDDIKRCTLWEFYDLQNKFYCVFAENGDDFLLEPTDFPYPYGSPFKRLPNYDVPDRYYCMGDLEAIESLQHELNATRSDMVNHRKRYQRAYLVKRDALNAEAQQSLLQNRDNRIVYIDGDEDLSNVVVPIQQPPLDPQMYQHSDVIEADVDLVSGVSEYQRGATSEIRRTATEAAMIQDASNARASEKLAQIEVFLSDVARCVVQLAQHYLTGDHMARIVGMDGAQAWVPFDIERIQGEFDFSVEAGSTQPKDESFRRQQALQLMNVMSPFIGTAVNPQTLAAYVLREGFGIKNVDQFILPPAPPSTGPSDKLIETISYKDAPPDVQRQMEAQAGMQPSAIGPNQPPPNPNAPNDPSNPQGAQGAPPQQGPSDMPMPQDATTLPTSGPQAIPPAMLTQLQGQVGLDVPHVSGG